MATPIAAAGTAAGAFVFFFFLLWFALFVAGILGFIFWIFMLVNVIKRNFKKENDKIMWILIVVLTGILGALIYYFMIKRPNKH
tara:strand:- start:487 stop:738 length:252 start_codon:yes stop_codon:yes gene_type:complete